jgi:hypothetical protein
MFISPQIIKSDFGFYTYFKIVSDFLSNSLFSPEEALYGLNIVR